MISTFVVSFGICLAVPSEEPLSILRSIFASIMLSVLSGFIAFEACAVTLLP